MIQEQKAKAYDEALERMKSWVRGEHPECFTEAQKAAEFTFPELKESEDERIKAFLTKTIQQVPNDSLLWETVDKSSVLAWLAKQGKQRYLTGVDLGDPSGDKGCIFNYSDATIPQKDFTPLNQNN